MGCTDCLAELDHCHGTLVEHHDGDPECTDSACGDLDRRRHDLISDCEIILGGCGCSQPEELSAVA